MPFMRFTKARKLSEGRSVLILMTLDHCFTYMQKRAFDDNEKNILIDFARTAAFQKSIQFKNSKANACFLDLCRLERERESLRVDFEAAGRIEKWLKEVGGFRSWKLFPSFLIFQSLRQSIRLSHCLVRLRVIFTGPDQSNRKGAMAWKLVSSFCRVHELKTSIVFRHACLPETILLPFFTRQKGRN